MLPIKKSVTFTGACANEIIPSINCSFVYKAKEGRHVRIIRNYKVQLVIDEIIVESQLMYLCYVQHLIHTIKRNNDGYTVALNVDQSNTVLYWDF